MALTGKLISGFESTAIGGEPFMGMCQGYQTSCLG